MTITVLKTSSGPYSAAAQTTFAVDFQSGGPGEITVLLNGSEVPASQYRFFRNANGTGSVVFNTAVTGTVLIRSNPSFRQEISFQRFGAFYPDQIDPALDKAAVRQLWLRDRVGSALALAEAAIARAMTPGPPGERGPAGASGDGGKVVASRTALALASVAAGAYFLSEAGREGMFVWDPAVPVALHSIDTQQGLYVAPSATTAGAWVRQFAGPINPQWFGFIADYNRDTGVGTDNLAAFNALKTLLTARTIAGWSRFERGGDPVEVPKGRYFFSGPLEFKGFTIRFTGAGVGLAGGDAVQFYYPPNTDGIRVQAYNTLGTGVDPDPNGVGADGCHFEGIALFAQNGGTIGSGFVLRARASIVNCKAFNFGHHGAKAQTSAGSGGSLEGNANSWYFENCRFNHNGIAGLYIDGADTNAGTAINVTGDYNGSYAIFDSSVLGNLFIGCHSDSNGQINSGNHGNAAVRNATAQVSHNGNAFHVQPGQAVGASTNAPPTTATDNQWWGFMFAQAAGGTFPAWTSGIATKEGAAYKHDDSNATSLFLACYSEGGQPPSQIMSPAEVKAGMHGAGFTRNSTAAISHVEGGRLIHRNGVGATTGPDRRTGVTLGGDDARGVLNIFDTNFAPNGWRLKVDNGDLRADHGNADASRLLHFTGQGTQQTFGTGNPVRDAAYFHKLMVGADLGSGRILTNGTGAPTTGAWAWGSIVLNRDPVAGSPLGWRCVGGGTPGTWEPINLGGGTGGTTDPEIVRDTIAAALRQGPGISIVHDDAADTITISATGGGGGGDITVLATRSDISALPVPASTGRTVMLTEAGRQGLFVWDPTVPVAIHQLDAATRGVYIAPSATAAGAWVRQFDGSRMIATWFGARAAGTAFDNGPAARAMMALSQVWNGNSGTRKTNQLYELHFPPAPDTYHFSTGTPARAAVVDGATTLRPAQPAQPGVVLEVTDAFKFTGVMSNVTTAGTVFSVAPGLTMFAFISAEHPNSAHGAGIDGILVRATGKLDTTTDITAMPQKVSGNAAQTDITVVDSSQFKVGDVVLIRGMYAASGYKNRSSAFPRNRVATTAGSNRITFPQPVRFRGGEVLSWDNAGFEPGSFIQLVNGAAQNTVFDMMKIDGTGAVVPSNATTTLASTPGIIHSDFATQIRAIPNATTITLADGIFQSQNTFPGIGTGAGQVLRRRLERFDSAVYTECQVTFGNWGALNFKGAGFFATGNTALKSRTGRDVNCNESLIWGKYGTGDCFTGVLMMGSDCNGIAFYGFNGRQSTSWCFIDASGTGCRSFGGHYAGTLGLFVVLYGAKSVHIGYKETGTDYCIGGGTSIDGTGWGNNVVEAGGSPNNVDDSGRRLSGPQRPYGSAYDYDWTIGEMRQSVGLLRLNAEGLGYSQEFCMFAISNYSYPGQNNGLLTTHEGGGGVPTMSLPLGGSGRRGLYAHQGVKYGSGRGDIDEQYHRLHRYGAAPPPATEGVDRDVVWNLGTDAAFAAVDFWIKRAGAWVARP